MSNLNAGSYIAELPAHIDATMMTAFRSCPRKFYHEFVLGLRGKQKSVHLVAGGAFAAALEAFYTRVFNHDEPTAEALKHAFHAFTTEWGDYTKEQIPRVNKSYDRMWEAVCSYIATYPPLTDHVQPYRSETSFVTTEYSFALPLDPGEGFPLHPVTHEPFIYSGRFDMLGAYNGRPCVRDEKTTTSFRDNWADIWALRSQFMGYVWACQQHGIPLDTVVIRGVAIQMRDIKHLEAVKVFPRFMIERWYEQLKLDLNRLVSAWQNEMFDYNFGDSCSSYSGCHFQSLCTSFDPVPWMQEYEVRRWDPLTRTNKVDGSAE